ncbi:MAG: response regulator [Saprospiraceae bacterium]
MLKGKQSILVIEDQKSIRLLLNAILRKEFDVTTLSDGLAGMAWLNEGNIPDLILLDMQMPTVDGFQFLKVIKKSGIFSGIPVVVISGNESPLDKETCLSLGASYFLNKPFDPKELLNKIEGLLRPVAA